MAMAAVHKPSLANLGHWKAAGAHDAGWGEAASSLSFPGETEGNAEQVNPPAPNFNTVRRESGAATSFFSVR
ncbi:MAG: hypothetical protein FJ388_20100 [Verrucomicrobia bacterium]|nr:hypothetical protein [Verrucomicrobiota bacterium]